MLRALVVFIIFSLVKDILSFDKPCYKCNHFIPNLKNPELSLCGMFKESFYFDKNKDTMIENFAIHCRRDENLCGKSGYLFDPINTNTNSEANEPICDDENKGIEYIEENLAQLENYEKEFVEIFQKMRRHNTKMVYRTPRELYKLFKNKK